MNEALQSEPGQNPEGPAQGEVLAQELAATAPDEAPDAQEAQADAERQREAGIVNQLKKKFRSAQARLAISAGGLLLGGSFGTGMVLEASSTSDYVKSGLLMAIDVAGSVYFGAKAMTDQNVAAYGLGQVDGYDQRRRQDGSN